jgi:rubrerythrin
VKKPTDLGSNRTGIATAPLRAQATLKGAVDGDMDQADLGESIAARERFSSEAMPVGTMPPPATLRGAAKTALSALKGQKATVFLDKLGERLAFERTGVRLYEALMVKLEAASEHPGRPSRNDLQRIRSDEYRHFQIVKQAIQSLGGDPTAMTPCANVTAVASSGIPKVLTDPRTTLNQCLGAILTAELVDNDGWQMLADMAEKLGQTEMAEQFRDCLTQEAEHLEMVRSWLANGVEGEAGIRDTRVARMATVVRGNGSTRPSSRRRPSRSARRSGNSTSRRTTARRARASSRTRSTPAKRGTRTASRVTRRGRASARSRASR